MLYHCAEEETGAEGEEEGEWLMKIEERNGQQLRTWTRLDGKGKGKGGKGGWKGGKGVECYRCGRTGHIRGDCHARKHVNGGKPKEFKKKTLNNIEEEEGGEEDCGGLDICMLEAATFKKDLCIIEDPFKNSRRPLIMDDPFKKPDKKIACQSNPFDQDSAVMIEHGRRLFEGDVQDSVDTNPGALDGRPPCVYSVKTLRQIAKKASEEICNRVRASMELIVENAIEEMQREILDQEVFKFKVIEGWEPMDEEDLDATNVENHTAADAENIEDEVEVSAMDAGDKAGLDLLAFDDMEVDSKGWEKIDVTVDSGAAHSVADGDAWPAIPRMESEGSRAGSVYLGPGKERIPNRGQKSLNVKTAGNSVIRKMTFQDAAARKPLAAVSIRELIRQVKNRIELDRKKGVYIMPIWVQKGGDDKVNEQKTINSRQGK